MEQIDAGSIRLGQETARVLCGIAPEQSFSSSPGDFGCSDLCLQGKVKIPRPLRVEGQSPDTVAGVPLVTVALGKVSIFFSLIPESQAPHYQMELIVVFNLHAVGIPTEEVLVPDTVKEIPTLVASSSHRTCRVMGSA